MAICFFASDLHGYIDRYEKLFRAIKNERPDAVFLGGDILPSASLMLSSPDVEHLDFINDYFAIKLDDLRNELDEDYPRIFLILGNDDIRIAESSINNVAAQEMLEYIHNRKVLFNEYSVFGYSYTPPSPFLLKDWEKYDVSRYVDPGCVSPEEGVRTVQISNNSQKYSTIKEDLDRLTGNEDLSRAIFLFHAPPYKTKLDRAALDGKMIDYVPVDVHIGSIAIQHFIKNHQPLLTLHGHVHESSRLSGSWQDRIGNTHIFTAAYDGPELALVCFDPANLDAATRRIF